MFSGLTFDICWATSSSEADPLPLSLMPGPACTESRCAPAITTLSSFVPVSSAITFFCGRCSGRGTDDACRRSRLREGDTLIEARADDGDAVRHGRAIGPRRRVATMSPAVGRVALVEDDDRFGARLLGEERLVTEVARTALDQRDVCSPRKWAGEVRRLATTGAGTVAGELDVDGDHVADDVAVAGAGEGPVG